MKLSFYQENLNPKIQEIKSALYESLTAESFLRSSKEKVLPKNGSLRPSITNGKDFHVPNFRDLHFHFNDHPSDDVQSYKQRSVFCYDR